MKMQTAPFDFSLYLKDDQTICNYLNDCLEEGGVRLFLLAICDVAKCERSAAFGDE